MGAEFTFSDFLRPIKQLDCKVCGTVEEIVIPSRNQKFFDLVHHFGVVHSTCYERLRNHFPPHDDSASSDNFIVVSYHSTELYTRLTNRLRKQLDHFKIQHDLVPVPPFKDWFTGAVYKTEFLQQMIDKHKGKNLLWLDSDAIIHRRPTPLMENEGPACDVACCAADPYFFCVGTLFLRNNDVVRKLLHTWRVENLSHPTWDDQANFPAALRQTPEVRLLVLPYEYYWFEGIRHWRPADAKPVIEHLMMSRLTSDEQMRWLHRLRQEARTR